jgi:hypothetical protein
LAVKCVGLPKIWAGQKVASKHCLKAAEEASVRHDIEGLEKKIKQLEGKIADFVRIPLPLVSIIYRPGWTTLAEWEFVNAGIDNLSSQIDVAAESCKRLLEAAEKVGTQGSRE